MRAPLVVRWPGVIKPGTIKNEIFASLDWVPTLVDIAGGAKGDHRRAKPVVVEPHNEAAEQSAQADKAGLRMGLAA
jgi:arylsulfatase A-like enzyme